jgi:hypothetical protein
VADKPNKPFQKESRDSLRVQIPQGEDAPVLELDGKTVRILDISEKAVRVEQAGDDAQVKSGKIEYGNGQYVYFAAETLRESDKDAVLLFSGQMADQFVDYYQHLSETQEEQGPEDERRVARRVKCNKGQVNIVIYDKVYDAIDITDRSVRIDKDNGRERKYYRGQIVFSDGTKYSIEGECVHSSSRGTVLLFSHKRLPLSVIAKEVLTDLDEYW